MLYRVIGVTALAVGAWAQQDTLFDKAPPEIDSALRERVKQFYDYHVQRKYRLADQLVAEDSKDIYFEANKTFMRSFQIKHIKYSDDFTRATVLISVDTDMMMLGAGKAPVIMPMQSTWKLENGQWLWYAVPFDPQKGVETPFGTMHKQDPNAPKEDQERKAVLAGIASAPTLKQIQSTVKASATAVRLSGYEASKAEIVLTNSFQGKVELAVLMTPLKGLEVRLEKATLGGGERGKVFFEYQPADVTPKSPREVTIEVNPTLQRIPIRVEFAVKPAEASQLNK